MTGFGTRNNEEISFSMENVYMEPEDLLSDETFLSWHFKTDPVAERRWDRWMASNPERYELVQQAVELLESLRMEEAEFSEERVRSVEKTLFAKIEEADREKPGAGVFSLFSGGRWIAAAGVVLLAAAAFFLFRSWVPGKPELKTTYGEIKQQKLPDGTEVFINANSKVSYSGEWTDGRDREVWIRGEAFFHVRKTPLKSRFIVHADRFDIIVTGTKFNVVNRAGRASVMLQEGSVTIHTAGGREIHMVPGDFVQIDADEMRKAPAKNDSILAWKERKLVFDNTPISEVVRIIKDHYGVNIELANGAIGDKTISGILPNDNLDVLLQALDATMQFAVIRQGDRITIADH